MLPGKHRCQQKHGLPNRRPRLPAFEPRNVGQFFECGRDGILRNAQSYSSLNLRTNQWLKMFSARVMANSNRPTA